MPLPNQPGRNSAPPRNAENRDPPFSPIPGLGDRSAASPERRRETNINNTDSTYVRLAKSDRHRDLPSMRPTSVQPTTVRPNSVNNRVVLHYSRHSRHEWFSHGDYAQQDNINRTTNGKKTSLRVMVPEERGDQPPKHVKLPQLPGTSSGMTSQVQPLTYTMTGQKAKRNSSKNPLLRRQSKELHVVKITSPRKTLGLDIEVKSSQSRFRPIAREPSDPSTMPRLQSYNFQCDDYERRNAWVEMHSTNRTFFLPSLGSQEEPKPELKLPSLTKKNVQSIKDSTMNNHDLMIRRISEWKCEVKKVEQKEKRPHKSKKFQKVPALVNSLQNAEDASHARKKAACLKDSTQPTPDSQSSYSDHAFRCIDSISPAIKGAVQPGDATVLPSENTCNVGTASRYAYSLSPIKHSVQPAESSVFSLSSSRNVGTPSSYADPLSPSSTRNVGTASIYTDSFSPSIKDSVQPAESSILSSSSSSCSFGTSSYSVSPFGMGAVQPDTTNKNSDSSHLERKSTPCNARPDSGCDDPISPVGNNADEPAGSSTLTNYTPFSSETNSCCNDPVSPLGNDADEPANLSVLTNYSSRSARTELSSVEPISSSPSCCSDYFPPGERDVVQPGSDMAPSTDHILPSVESAPD